MAISRLTIDTSGCSLSRTKFNDTTDPLTQTFELEGIKFQCSGKMTKLMYYSPILILYAVNAADTKQSYKLNRIGVTDEKHKNTLTNFVAFKQAEKGATTKTLGLYDISEGADKTVIPYGTYFLAMTIELPVNGAVSRRNGKIEFSGDTQKIPVLGSQYADPSNYLTFTVEEEEMELVVDEPAEILKPIEPVEEPDFTITIENPQYTKFYYNGKVKTWPDSFQQNAKSFQNVVIKGIEAGDVVLYSNSKDGPFTETKPTFLDAGTYTIWLKVQRANCKDYVTSTTLTLNPLRLSLGWDDSKNLYQKEYDGTTDIGPYVTVLHGCLDSDFPYLTYTATFEMLEEKIDITGFRVTQVKAVNGNVKPTKWVKAYLTSIGNVGENNYVKNYEMVNGDSISHLINIIPRQLTIIGTTIIEENGEAKVNMGTVDRIVGNDDVVVVVAGNEKKTDGTYTVTYSITGSSAENYKAPKPDNIKVK